MTIIIVQITGHAVVTLLIALAVSLQPLAVPVTGIHVHRLVVARSVYPILVSGLIPPLHPWVLAVLARVLTVLAVPGLIAFLVTPLISRQTFAVPVVGIHVHRLVVARSVYPILVSGLIPPLHPWVLAVLARVLTVLAVPGPIAFLVTPLISRQTVAVPVVGIHVHRLVVARSVYPILVSGLIPPLHPWVLAVLARVLTVLAVPGLIALLVTPLISRQTVAVPVVGIHVHRLVVARSVYPILVSGLIPPLHPWVLAVLARVLTVLAVPVLIA